MNNSTIVKLQGMHKPKVKFEIPIDIIKDIVYCKQALTTHILMHKVNIRRGNR